MAARGWLVTFGVVPDAPETGYGYIRKGAALDKSTAAPCRVSGFVEKPDLETARTYVDSGEYLWNSGIFMMRASAWLTALERFRPDIARACRLAQSNGHVDGAFYRPGAPDFLACPSESIDYAVMEKAAGISPEQQGRTARQRRGAAGRGLVGRGRVVGPVEARRTRQRRQRHTRRRIRAVHRGRPARVAAPAWWRPWASGTPWSSRRPTPCWWRTRTACRTSRRWCSVSRRTTGRRPRPTGGSTGPGEATR